MDSLPVCVLIQVSTNIISGLSVFIFFTCVYLNSNGTHFIFCILCDTTCLDFANLQQQQSHETGEAEKMSIALVNIFGVCKVLICPTI
jgi:hypothetical protein